MEKITLNFIIIFNPFHKKAKLKANVYSILGNQIKHM